MRTVADIFIRQLRDEDYPALARIHNAIHRDTPATAEEMRQEVDRIDRRRFVSEWLVAADRKTGDVVAYGNYRHRPWSHHPGKFNASINVHPDDQGRGIGRRMMDQILSALRILGGHHVTAWTREDWTRSVAFLQRFGFAEHTRDFESRLDVGSVDLGRFGDYAERVAQRGISITTLADELRRDPQCLPAVYQAHSVLDIGAPREDPELPTPPTHEEFLTQEVHHPRVLLDAFFLAKFEDLYIGESALKRSDGDPSLLHQQLTGVLPTYRGLGIATALKLRTIDYAQRGGYRVIRTFNSSRNDPMLAINGKLGFVRQPAWIGFAKRLEPASGAVPA